jgi:hypothetical protein
VITLHGATATAPTAVPRGPGLDAVIPGPHRAVGSPQVTTGRHVAWLRLWTTVLGLAFLTGRTLPAPPPQVLAAASWQPRRTARLVGSLAERLAAERGAALRGSYPPPALARALTGAGRRMLDGRPVPARAGQVWVIPQLRWAHEAARAGWERDGVRPDDLAPPLDFALAGLPDWPGILAGQRLEMLLRHPAALAAPVGTGPASTGPANREPANRALAATALFGADGRAAFGAGLTADLAQVFPTEFSNLSSRTDNGGSPGYHPYPAILAEAMRSMDCRADWLIAYLR